MTEIFFSVENSYNVNFPDGGGGVGGGTPDFKWRRWSYSRVKIKKPQKSLGLPAKPPKNSLGQNWPAKKIHVEFPSLKNLQKIWNNITQKVWFYLSAELLGWDKQALPRIFRLFWIYPRNPYLNQATQKNTC